MDELIILILQFIFELFGDLILQAFFEGICELIGYTIDQSWHRKNRPVWEALIGYVIFGGIAGFISVILVPHIFIHLVTWRIAALLIIPLLMGGLFTWVGRLRESRGQTRTGLDSFLYAYTFALSMALVRFWLVR